MPWIPDLISTPATHSWQRRWLGTRSYWLCQVLGWGGFCATFVWPVLFFQSGPDPMWGGAFSVGGVSAGAGLLFSHLLRVLLLWLLQAKRPGGVFVGVCLLWAAVIGALHAFIITIWTEAVVNAIQAELVIQWTLSDYVDSLNYTVALQLIWIGFYLGIRAYRQNQVARLDQARLESAAREAELRALKAQLNPHFLFNSLNSLRAMLPGEMERPREMVTMLAELLRSTLTVSRAATVSFEEELALVCLYLRLEHVNHGARLRWTVRGESSALTRPCPPFLLQGLVENAMKYGIGAREEGGCIEIDVEEAEGGCRLRVRNPGRLAAASKSTGLGLANHRARLALLFGPSARLTLREIAPELVEAEAWWPLDVLPPASAPAPA